MSVVIPEKSLKVMLPELNDIQIKWLNSKIEEAESVAYQTGYMDALEAQKNIEELSGPAKP